MEIEKVFPFLPKKGEFFVTSLKQSQSHFSWHCGASSFFLSSISSSLEKAFFVKSTLKLASTFSCHPITTWTLEASLENPSSVNRGLLLAWRPLVGSDASSLGVERERDTTLFPHGETMLMILQWHRSRFIVRKAWISRKSLLKSSSDLVPPSKICSVKIDCRAV